MHTYRTPSKIMKYDKIRQIRRLLSIAVAICGVAIAIFCTAYQNRSYRIPRHVALSDYQDGESLWCQYDISITEQNKDYNNVSGWIVAPGHEIAFYDTQIILYEEGSVEGLRWSAKMENRSDVTEALNDGMNYDASGFVSLIPSAYTEGKNYKVAIAFYVDQTQYVVKTGQEYAVQ